MISPEDQARCVRLYHAERWRVGTIARQLGIHHRAVRRALERAGALRPQEAPRPSLIDPYVPFILETLKKFPELSAARLHAMVRERGYSGARDHFRHLVARLRPRPEAEAYLRLRTLPGQEAQADWAHCGKFQVGKALRTLWAFVLTLSHSRRIFLRFYPGAGTGFFLDGHVHAFCAWRGSPRVVLYDNLKSVVLDRVRDAIRFHPEILSLATHYRFEPRPVAPARGNEKGRVERSIRYIRSAFLAAREWKDLEDLNRQAQEWTEREALERRWPDDETLTVAAAFALEQQRLVPLPETPFGAEERTEVSVGKTPYVRFDLNDYSVPHDRVRRTLVVLSTSGRLRILDDQELVATHVRSYDKGARIEDPRHVERLVEQKRAARRSRGLDRLVRAAPSAEEILARLAARGQNLGLAVRQLLGLLETYGAEELEGGMREALLTEVCHPHAVRHLIEKRRRAEGHAPTLPLVLDPRVREITVRLPSLEPYDRLKEVSNDDDEDGAACALVE